MAEKLKNHIPLITNMITVLTIVLCIIFAVYGYRAGIFESKESLIAFIKALGLWGPLVFMFIQALQVVIPVLPGFVTCIVGALVFGPVMGFVYSYIGMCIGSILAFIIARRYGIDFVKKFVNEKTYDKYASWLEKGKKFDIFFMLAISSRLLPTTCCVLSQDSHVCTGRNLQQLYFLENHGSLLLTASEPQA